VKRSALMQKWMPTVYCTECYSLTSFLFDTLCPPEQPTNTGEFSKEQDQEPIKKTDHCLEAASIKLNDRTDNHSANRDNRNCANRDNRNCANRDNRSIRRTNRDDCNSANRDNRNSANRDNRNSANRDDCNSANLDNRNCANRDNRYSANQNNRFSANRDNHNSNCYRKRQRETSHERKHDFKRRRLSSYERMLNDHTQVLAHSYRDHDDECVEDRPKDVNTRHDRDSHSQRYNDDQCNYFD